MPKYEYVCHSCKNAFSKSLTIVAYEEDKISCPKCDSKDYGWNKPQLRSMRLLQKRAHRKRTI